MHALAYDAVHDEIIVNSPLAQAILIFRGGANGEREGASMWLRLAMVRCVPCATIRAPPSRCDRRDPQPDCSRASTATGNRL